MDQNTPARAPFDANHGGLSIAASPLDTTNTKKTRRHTARQNDAINDGINTKMKVKKIAVVVSSRAVPGSSSSSSSRLRSLLLLNAVQL